MSGPQQQPVPAVGGGSGSHTPLDADLARVARLLEVELPDLARARQVHGTAVFVVESAASTRAEDAQDARTGDVRVALREAGGALLPEADILATRRPGSAVSVRTADCVPVLLADGRTGAVAAVHAGWRGTARNASGAGVGALVALGSDPADLVAAIGPSIGPCCYEVGDDVRLAFEAGAAGCAGARWFSPGSDGRWMLDVAAANHDQLREAGVLEESISVSRLCTATHLDLFYSYRREGPRAGRLIAAIRCGQAVDRTD